MLGKFVNMAELSRQMGLKDAQMMLADAGVRQSGAPLFKGGHGAVAGEKAAERAAQAAQIVDDVCGDDFSEIELCGLRLDQRAELVTCAQKLLDQGVSVPEVLAALEHFAMSRAWQPLSTTSLKGIIQSAWDAIWDAEEAAEAAAAARPAVQVDSEPVELLEFSLAEVSPEPVRWLWPGKIPLGRVTVIYGEAGIGKTSVALDLASRVSAGTNWPDASGAPEAGRVLIVNGEDPLRDTICPRLTSSGARLQNISVIAGMRPQGPEVAAGVASPGAAVSRSFDLGRDLTLLRLRVEALGNVRLVIIDPLEAYCGKMGSNRTKLREVIAELAQLAADCGVAIVVMSAATKCDLPVKNVWRVDCEMLDATSRCWVPVRYNCGPLPAGLAFRVNDSGVAWQQRSAAPAANRVRGTSAQHERCRQLQETANWLREYLVEGPCPAKQVLAAAGAAGWSIGQVKRAKQELGIRCYKEREAQGQWIWDACGACGERVEGSELRIDLRRIEEIEEVEGIKEFKEVA